MTILPAPRPAPTSISPWLSLMLAVLALLPPLAIRGPQRSLQLLAASLLVATGGEALAIRGTRTLRHHSHPQIGDLPLPILLSWYAVLAPSYGLAQAAVGKRGPGIVSLVTALLATATDLANDPWGLASGYWEWRDGGPYMPDLVGANGVTGIPVSNYVSWLVIAASVARLAEVGRPPAEHAAARRRRTLLLVLYWVLGMGGVRWAVTERRWRLLAAGAAAVLGGGATAWAAAGRDTGA